MFKTSPGAAVATLREQVEIIEGDSISLDSLWRAAGRPRGKDPRSWVELASPLVSGFADYLSKLSPGATRPSDALRVLWEWEADDSDPWRTGDLMSVCHIAEIYAAFLDGDHGAAPARRSAKPR